MQFLTQGWGIARPLGPFINGQLGTKAVVLSCSLGVEPEMKKAKGGLFSEKFSQEHTGEKVNIMLNCRSQRMEYTGKIHMNHIKGNNTEYSLFISNTSVDHFDRLYPKVNWVTLL